MICTGFRFDAITPADRHRLLELKSQGERVARYAEHLNLADRALLKSIYERGIAPATLAQASQCSRKQIYQRVRRALERINSPMFEFILRHRLQWPEFRRMVAEGFFIRGEKQRDLALRLGMSLYHVRKEVERVRTIFEIDRGESSSREMELNDDAS